MEFYELKAVLLIAFDQFLAWVFRSVLIDQIVKSIQKTGLIYESSSHILLVERYLDVIHLIARLNRIKSCFLKKKHD